MVHKPKINAKSGCIIGLTGGIASGKSYILSCFQELGFKIFDTDQEVLNLFKRGNAGYEKVGELFPAALGDDCVDKKKLSQIVLNSTKDLQRLEEAIHPIVRQNQDEFTKKNEGRSIVFEVPLLFENERKKHYDYVISAMVDTKIQKERSLKRKGMTNDKLDAILSRQVTRDVHLQKAHFVIDTSGTKEETFNKIKALIEDE